ncbi:WAP four-disulfide core domain protein 1-like isoform X3 [Amphiura filiformis]|uniref:WAP four-disulfide core domain protein 1-like isoform X3 n=1 Tax=Amphiura filiformis TaxID=82378 RepID=UPI003B213515
MMMRKTFRLDLLLPQFLFVNYLTVLTHGAHFGFGHRSAGPFVCGVNVQVHDIGTVYRHNLPESTESQHSGRCPPAPNELMPEACDVCMCWSDSQCGPDQKCCYNGCMQTCLHKVKPPPVLDWLIEPTRRPLIKGNTWLMPGPETQDTAETCSTSIEDGVSPYNVLQDMCVPYRT